MTRSAGVRVCPAPRAGRSLRASCLRLPPTPAAGAWATPHGCINVTSQEERAPGSKPDVTDTVRARRRKRLAHPVQQFRPCNPGGVVGAGFLIRVAAAFRGVPVGMPTRGTLTLLANVPDRQRPDGFPQTVIRGRHPAVAVPVFSRWWDKVRQTIDELKQRQLDHAVGSRSTTAPRPQRSSPDNRLPVPKSLKRPDKQGYNSLFGWRSLFLPAGRPPCDARASPTPKTI